MLDLISINLGWTQSQLGIGGVEHSEGMFVLNS